MLEHDGIVRQRGSVPRCSGGRKPAYIYELTPEAEDLFPKAYEPVLGQLLDVLAGQLGPEESEALLRNVGRRIAGEQTVPADRVHARLGTAVDVLNELGGLAELDERDGSVIIRAYSCPLTAVVPAHPEVCRIVEALITELAGVPVHEHCGRSERPRWCLDAALSETPHKKGEEDSWDR
jgi:predicted ArsR family transcriptional regulator